VDITFQLTGASLVAHATPSSQQNAEAAKADTSYMHKTDQSAYENDYQQIIR